MNDIQPLECLNNLIDDIDLPSFQNIGIQKVLLNKKMLLAFDTGLGKTFTYSAIVRGLLNNNPEGKHIFVVIHDSITQAEKDIKELVRVPTMVFTNADGEFRRLVNSWDKLSIIILTYQCFMNCNLNLFLFKKIREVESFVIDEAHHVSQWDKSDVAYIIRGLAQYAEYVVALTATPITSDKTQYFKLLNVIDRSLSHRRDETSAGKYSERYMSVNRSDYNLKGNYKTTLELVTPTVDQIGEIKGVVSKIVKGQGAVPQVKKLMEVLDARLKEDKSIIVYIHYHSTREWVESNLKQKGIKFVSLHGKITNKEEREVILSKFKSKEVRVLLTSISESLNIDSDVVVFYEFTTKLKQVVGRAHRGLNIKQLELVFIITMDTEEVDFFLKYIYKRSLVIQDLLGKDYSEFIEVGRKLKEISEDEPF